MNKQTFVQLQYLVGPLDFSAAKFLIPEGQMTADSARGNSPAISNNISEVVVKNKSHQRKRREVLTNSILRSEIYSVILFTDSFFSHHL